MHRARNVAVGISHRLSRRLILVQARCTFSDAAASEPAHGSEAAVAELETALVHTPDAPVDNHTSEASQSCSTSTRELKPPSIFRTLNAPSIFRTLNAIHSKPRFNSRPRRVHKEDQPKTPDPEFMKFVSAQASASVNSVEEFTANHDGIPNLEQRLRGSLDERQQELRHIRGENSISRVLSVANAPHLEPDKPVSPRKLPFYKRHIEGTLSPGDGNLLEDIPHPLGGGQARIPCLSHGLDRVLTNPGVHWLREPRTRSFNFPDTLKDVPKVEDFAFERVGSFITSSRDNILWAAAKQSECIFTGSTSSLTGMLSLIYLLLSNEKQVDTSILSAPFQKMPKTFTPGQRMPVSVSLKYRDGVYSTDSDKSHLPETETILSQLGIVLEKFFTVPYQDFKNMLSKRSPVPLSSDIRPREAYRYAKYGKFVMRSQLDCHHPSIPGTGVFDIKSRAASPIRYDLENYKDNLGYNIRTTQGLWESFEREYYDLIRSAFLKYSFQARIGNMDGIFVAYHNTERLFGFQYIPLEEMDQRLYGHTAGMRVFNRCISLLEVIFNEIVLYFPKQSVNCTWETRNFGGYMHIWVEPQEWNQNSEKPLVQLDINITNVLNGEKVSGQIAAGSVEGQWDVQYKITKSMLPQEEIRARRQAAFDRQLLIYKYGLGPDEKAPFKSSEKLDTNAAKLAEWLEKKKDQSGVGDALRLAKKGSKATKRSIWQMLVKAQEVVPTKKSDMEQPGTITKPSNVKRKAAWTLAEHDKAAQIEDGQLSAVDSGDSGASKPATEGEHELERSATQMDAAGSMSEAPVFDDTNDEEDIAVDVAAEEAEEVSGEDDSSQELDHMTLELIAVLQDRALAELPESLRSKGGHHESASREAASDYLGDDAQPTRFVATGDLIEDDVLLDNGAHSELPGEVTEKLAYGVSDEISVSPDASDESTDIDLPAPTHTTDLAATSSREADSLDFENEESVESLDVVLAEEISSTSAGGSSTDDSADHESKTDASRDPSLDVLDSQSQDNGDHPQR
ncbi:Pet127-domain-containing protein [Wolfiporia cocos MD-104 SS10]|uniref:Pet127-domain-containing protein n=1 Tax=Wolfiporia cocos (strain MD-104) TaxID=742152 RepID=A0A2H3JCU3_WOLCO|nr:Pet127-domain-containing protein [Wolfiporia cocos MD-104 SS10]